jgi:hypothetical protein
MNLNPGSSVGNECFKNEVAFSFSICCKFKPSVMVRKKVKSLATDSRPFS